MENGTGVPTVASVMISIAVIALGGALMVPMWRRGISWATLAFAVTGGVLASGGGSVIAREAGAEGWVGTLARFAAVAVAAWVAHAFVRARQERSGRTASDPASRDPGWPLWALLPGATLFLSWIRDPSTARDQLTVIRMLFMSFAIAMVLFWFVLSFIGHEPASESSTDVAVVFAVVTALMGAVSRIVGSRLESRIVDADDASMVTVYRGTWFVRVGVAEAGPLLGFAGTFLSAAPWLYPFALAASVPAWVALAPSTRNLTRIDEARRHAGRRGSLYERLLEPPPAVGGP